MNKFDIEIPTLRIESPEPGELFKTLSCVKKKSKKIAQIFVHIFAHLLIISDFHGMFTKSYKMN